MGVPTFSLLVLAATASAAVSANPAPQSQQSQGVAALRSALTSAVDQHSTPPGQLSPPVDPDQGDDHASDRAIQTVCSKDNPAAQRSAICPAPISPE